MGAPQAAGPDFLSNAVLVNGQFFSQQNAQKWHVVLPSGAIYAFQNLIGTGGANINGSGMYKSVDGGNTWAEMDAAHRPSSGVGSSIYDPANNQILCALVTDTSPQSQQTVFLKPFNLLTDTWGANFAPGGPLAQTVVQAVFRKPNNNIWVLYDFGPTNPGGTTRLRANEWNGAAWTGEIDAGASILPFLASGNIIVGSVCADMDPATGNIHLAFNSNTGTVYMYQLILNNQTLSTSNHFGFAGLSQNQFGNLIVANGNVFIVAADSANTNNFVLIGTPLNAPVFTTVTPAAMAAPAGHVNNPGSIAFDGTKLYWMISTFDITFFTYPNYKIFTSTDNGATWTIVPNNATEPFFYDFAPGQSPVDPNANPLFGAQPTILALGVVAGVTTAYGYAGVQNNRFGAAGSYFINSEAMVAPLAAQCNNPPAGSVGAPYTSTFTATGGTPPYVAFAIVSGILPPGLHLNAATGVVSGSPSSGGTFTFTVQVTDSAAATATVVCSIVIAFAPIVAIGGGDQVVHGGCRPMNEFDFCLLREMDKWKRIHPLPVCSVPKDLWGVLPWEPEWGSLPALAVPFRKIQSIVTPAAAAGDQVVSQLVVPQGYDGILAGVYWHYNGIGFIEGSGDIFWRIQVNMRFVKDLSNVGFTLGSSISPLPMTEGQLLQSRQRVSIVVNVPDISGMIQVGTSTITGGLFGFFWPKGVPGWTSR